MILSLHAVNKSFDGKDILRDASFHVENNEKVAIVGINGAGKTTLLRLITGELTPDDGEVTFSRDVTFGYLAQNQNIDSTNTIYEEFKEVKRDVIELEENIRKAEEDMKHLQGKELEDLLNRYTRMNEEFQRCSGYAWKSEVTGVARGLGFIEEEFDKKISTLSGGQKTRVALGKLLLQSPDLIILDEPTNHLDMNSIRWLENYLLNYKGAVIIVSHDRYFLDKIAQKVIEVENCRVSSFTGNYSDYAIKKEQKRAIEWNAYIKQQQEIKHQEEVIAKLKSFNREKSIKRAESREKMLDKIEVLDKPMDVNDSMKITLKPNCESGNDVLTAEGLTKSFGSEKLFEGLDFEIKKGEHVAIIGDNGTGKTTLLKMINQATDIDAGTITLGVKVHIGYYDQEHHVLHDEKTLFQEISDAYPTLNNTEIRNTLAAFLFTGDDVFKRIGDLSGGEKGRVSLAKLMLSDANFLILDEPTNHLDMNSIRWLENYLLNYKGAVIIVSHDRYFLDKIADKVIEVENCRVSSFTGNYSDYAIKKEQKRAIEWNAYIKQQAEIKHQEEVIAKLKSFNREKSIKRAESREKMLDKIEVLDKPVDVNDSMKITLKPNCESGGDVLTVEGLSKSFGNEKLFEGLDFEIKKGEHVAIIGDNGTGKTTLLKMINQAEPIDAGKITYGVKVHVGYYDQEHHVLHDEKTLFEEISDAYPTLNNTQIRNTLAAFLFTGDDVFKRIGDLSGGEKGRVSLAKLMLSDANFLILDEPTNHLDITSKEILESAISGYEGTVLYVSHDRYFINKTATRILDLTRGKLVGYIGNYDYYLEHVDERMERLFGEKNLSGPGFADSAYKYEDSAAASEAESTDEAKLSSGADDWKAQKEAQAKKRKQEAALKKCEEEIEKLEARDAEITELLSDPSIGTDLGRLRKLSDEQSDLQQNLQRLYDEWEELSL